MPVIHAQISLPFACTEFTTIFERRLPGFTLFPTSTIWARVTVLLSAPTISQAGSKKVEQLAMVACVQGAVKTLEKRLHFAPEHGSSCCASPGRCKAIAEAVISIFMRSPNSVQR